MIIKIKKNISLILKLFLPSRIYRKRRATLPFQIYISGEMFIKTFFLRLLYIKYFFLPSKHLGAIYLLKKISKIFKKNNKKFFLWEASLLGVTRGQRAIAGSASDIDLAIILKKKDLKFLNNLKKKFKIKFHFKFNSVQLFHPFGIIDFALFNKKGKYYEHSIDNPKIIKYRINKNKFLPFKKTIMYNMNFLIPNNSLFLVKKFYGPKWKTPHKKRQVYL